MILALRVVLVAKLVISGILSSIYFFFYLTIIYISLLTTSFFTASFNLLESTGIGNNLLTFNLSTSVFKLLKLVGTFFVY